MEDMDMEGMDMEDLDMEEVLVDMVIQVIFVIWSRNASSFSRRWRWVSRRSLLLNYC
jgi:hypothetical protein